MPSGAIAGSALFGMRLKAKDYPSGNLPADPAHFAVARRRKIPHIGAQTQHSKLQRKEIF